MEKSHSRSSGLGASKAHCGITDNRDIRTFVKVLDLEE